MTIFIRICVWLAVTLIAILVSMVIGVIMAVESGNREDAFIWSALTSFLVLGGSLTVNLIQAGYI